MSQPRGVLVGDGAYAVAIAELPVRATRATRTEGSIVVLGGGTGWASRALTAAGDGAAGIVVVSPRARAEVPLELEIPVVVQRPLLRADVVHDAEREAAPRALLVEASAARSDFESVLREGIGWARSLSGSRLELGESRLTSRALLAHLDGTATVASVMLARREAAPAWLRALAIDSTRTEILIDRASGSTTVSHTDARGRHEPPARHETAERLALRRVLDAIHEDARPTDLDDFDHDARLASQVLAVVRAE